MTSGPAQAKPRGLPVAAAFVAAMLFLVASPDLAHANAPALAPPFADVNGLAGERASPSSAHPRALSDAPERTAFWPFFTPRRPPIYESQPHNVTPHPAVARISVPEQGATAFGSGTLVDVREQYGLVVTNWHVVRDACGPVDVAFPSGFRSHARPLKVDSNWDLAALVIWRPSIEPVQLAQRPPQPGDLLTIHGYGRGQYRIATGRCTSYYAPRLNYPMEMVELDVEARQGDSGGPIFNHCGELAGVLFGAGHGTTLGSYAPRVSNFLATLAPDIGQANDQAKVAVADRPAPNVQKQDDSLANSSANYPSAMWFPPNVQRSTNEENSPRPEVQLAANPAADSAEPQPSEATHFGDESWYESLKTALAAVGLLAIALKIVKLVS